MSLLIAIHAKRIILIKSDLNLVRQMTQLNRIYIAFCRKQQLINSNYIFLSLN